MFKRNFIFSLFILGIGFSCNDDDSPNTPMDPTSVIDFGDVALTDANGAAIGGGIDDDWSAWDSWSNTENELFDNSMSLCPTTTDETVISFYPNPFNEVGFLLFAGDFALDQVDLRLVNKDYEVLTEWNDVFISDNAPGTVSLMLESPDITVGDTLRLYYRIKQSDCEFRGHGDIIKQ